MSYDHHHNDAIPMAPMSMSYPVNRREPGRLPAARVDPELLTLLLDEVGQGLALLDADGRLCWANRVAQRAFQRTRTLAVRQQRLVAESPADAQTLQRALAGVARGRRAMVRLGRGETTTPLALIPLAANPTDAPTHTLVLLGRHDTSDRLSLHFFASACQLTSAEAGVLEALSRGNAPAQVAAAGHIAVSTVRSHITAVRQKTGARSIIHLLRMVAGLPPMVSPVDDCGLPN